MVNAFELFILLLGYEVILMSETVAGQQTQLNSLQHTVSELDLKVNMNKSDMIVCVAPHPTTPTPKGGYLSAIERWIYNGFIMPASVNAYKYLAI